MKKPWSLAKRSAVCFGAMTLLAAAMILMMVYLVIPPQKIIGVPFLLMVFLPAFILICFCFYRLVLLPFNRTTKTLRLFNNGYTVEGLSSIRVPLSVEMEKTIKRLQEQVDRPHAIKASERQAEYLALQNQINPHFLYNTLEAIRGEALSQGLTDIAEMTEALATFFRYTISKVGNLVTLEDELGNIENYFIIQKFRFGDRINLSVVYEENSAENVLEYRLPKLTLQPLVENAIYHGLECKLGTGTVTVEVETTQSRLIILIKDNGVGIPEEKLIQLNQELKMAPQEIKEAKPGGRGGIAMFNVNNRIKLLFGEQYGLHLTSQPGIGTEVEITLPLIKK